MQFRILALAGALCLAAAPTLAGPPLQGHVAASDIPGTTHLAHHKPGHHGGPPWTRRNRDDDRRSYGEYRERRTVCRTTYRTHYDPYYDEYVRREVRTCD